MNFFLCPVLLIIVFISNNSAFAYDHTYKSYNEILKQAVLVKGHQSLIDYTVLKSDTSKLDDFVEGIEYIGKNEFDTWRREQQMAFLINAYNALTIKLILDNYPDITSIRDLGGLLTGSPWKKKFFTLLGRKSSLDHIEHELLRKNYKEPRLHFALVCASKSCPPMRNEAYAADSLDQQLSDAGTNFIRDPLRNRFNVKKNKLELSKIFKWYKKDFELSAGSLNTYIAAFMTNDEALRSLITSKDTDIKFLDYDWSLNDVR